MSFGQDSCVDDLFRKLKNKAIQLLSRREHGVAELIGKLSVARQPDALLRGQRHEVAVKVVEELLQRDYVSDERFAEMTVRGRANQGRGPMRIRQELQQKKVPGEIAEHAMEAAEIDWFANAIAMREKKFGLGVVSDMKLKAKQQRFLQYKGYGFDHIQHAMEAVNDACDEY